MKKDTITRRTDSITLEYYSNYYGYLLKKHLRWRPF